MPTNDTHRTDIDVENVIATAARTSVAETRQDMDDQLVQHPINNARRDQLYQLMITAVRPETAAAVLVRNAMRNAREYPASTSHLTPSANG